MIALVLLAGAGPLSAYEPAHDALAATTLAIAPVRRNALVFGGGSMLLASTGTRWGPNGNGTLAHSDDVRWLDLHDAKVTADTAAGLYTARFGPFLQQMDRQDFVITGFMMPVVANVMSNHFVITRRSATCPFCPPNEPTEAIEVFSQKFVNYTDRPVTVEGKFHLVGSSEKGLFYRLDNATVH